MADKALVASVPLFTSIFSNEDVTIVLEEYTKFVEKSGGKLKNKWSEFYRTCSLKDKYNPKQISEKIRRLEAKFQKQIQVNSSPPRDPHKLHLFNLSKSLWGPKPKPNPNPNPQKRSLLLTTSTNPSNKKPKIQCTDLDVEELELYQEMLILHRTQCEMILQKLKSTSSKKQSEEKDMSQPLLIEALNTTQEDPRGDESKEERELSLQIIEPPIDGVIFNKEEMDIVEGEELENKAADLSIACVEDKIENKAEELENKAADLSIDCVEEKTENQQLVSPNSGVMDNVLPLPALRDVKVEDDGTKKRSSKKKKKKKKMMMMKEDKKETSCKVENRLFGLAILVMEEGGANGKLACKGAKVKIHITGKVKDSEHLFESTKEGEPHIVKLDDERMIEGLRTGIEGMRVGEKRRIIIPPSLGYGDEGCEGMVPPNSWLEYEVHLIDATMPR